MSKINEGKIKFIEGKNLSLEEELRRLNVILTNLEFESNSGVIVLLGKLFGDKFEYIRK